MRNASGPANALNVAFGRREDHGERTHEPNRSPTSPRCCLSASATTDPQRSYSRCDLRRNPSPKVHIDCSENAGSQALPKRIPMRCLTYFIDVRWLR